MSALFLIAWAVALCGLSAGCWMAFFYAPTEPIMGFVQRIFYFHVPSAWVMFLAVAVCASASIAYLLKGRASADRLAAAAGELAALFGLMVLISGPLWAKKAWNAYWVWDVRLTSTLLLELMLLAYQLLRAFGGRGASRFAAGLAIFGVVNVPLIYYSVDVWRGTHPPRLVASGRLHPDMAATLYVCGIGFLALFLVLLWTRTRQLALADRVEELVLQAEDREAS